MIAMKKKLIIIAVLVIAFVTSYIFCGTEQNDAGINSINVDGTYLLTRTFKEKQNEREKLRGTFQVLDGNILMLVHPSMNEKSLLLLDSFGNEPKK